MDTSIFLARLLGPSMLVIGLGLLLNRATYRDLSLEVLDNPALIYLAGLIALVAGLAIVLTTTSGSPAGRRSSPSSAG